MVYIANFLGPIGKWQLRTIFLIYLVKIPSSWFMSCLIFTAPKPEHGEVYCKPPIDNISSHLDDWIKIAHPLREKNLDLKFAINYCEVYKDADQQIENFFQNISKNAKITNFRPKDSTKLIPCSSFEHQPVIFTSIITQFRLYCSRDILVAVTQFSHLLGVLCGGLLTSYMLKFIEPRRTMLIGMVMQVVCGNLTGLAKTYELHTIFRCLSAVCCGLMYNAGGVIFADITSGKYKIIAICLFEQFWSVGIMLLPSVASYWSSWSEIYMAISYPTILLVFLYPWIPNSPRWLLNHCRVEDAKEVLLNAAKINGKTNFSVSELEKQLLKQAAEEMEIKPKLSYCKMWRGRVKNLGACYVSLAITIVTYYGFLLNIRNFGQDHLEENTIICGICEIIGTFIGLLLILHTERKWLYVGVFNVLASFISLSVNLIPENVSRSERLTWLVVTSMASKIAISSLLSILMTCTTEIVAPEKRILCAFTATVWTRFWLLTAPFVGATSAFGPLVPQNVFSILNIFASLVTLLIVTPRSVEKPPKDFHPIRSSEVYFQD